MVRICCISDSHGYNLRTKINWEDYPADVLIHAGDGTARGTEQAIKLLGRQLMDLPYRYKVFSPGNHDKDFYTNMHQAIEWLGYGVITLIDESVTLMGLNIHGFPWLPNVSGVQKFTWETDDLKEKTDSIPPQTDILVSHTPPYGILDAAWRNTIKMGYDKSTRNLDNKVEHLGNQYLSNRMALVCDNFHPKLIVSGHVHEAYGQSEFAGTKIINASLCNRDIELVNLPIVVEV